MTLRKGINRAGGLGTRIYPIAYSQSFTADQASLPRAECEVFA